MTERDAAPVVAAYAALLAAVGERAAAIGSRPVVSHWPHRGSDGASLLIVGQAVYGWADDWRAADAATAEGRRTILDTTLARNRDADEPMGWIEHSDRRASLFWVACRQLAESDAPWWGRFTWANLYPVAWEADPSAAPSSPASHPDNPGGELRKAQDPHVARLLRATVDWLDPRIVVVLGGSYWRDAAPAAPRLAALPRPLIASGDVNGCRWVVGWHSNGANRRGWVPSRYVPLIVDATTR